MKYLSIVICTVILSIMDTGARAQGLQGKWNQFNFDKLELIAEGEFFRDGTYFVDSNGDRVPGKWTALGSNRFRLDFVVFGTPQMWFAEVRGDNMTMDAGKSKKFAFVRSSSSTERKLLREAGDRLNEQGCKRERELRAAGKTKSPTGEPLMGCLEFQHLWKNE